MVWHLKTEQLTYGDRQSYWFNCVHVRTSHFRHRMHCAWPWRYDQKKL